MEKKIVRLNEAQLKKAVAESVKKVLKEAQYGRGTTTTTSSSFSGDDFGGTTSYYFRTSENPFSNDSAQMLADRFEKRLGGGYSVEVHNNPQNSEKFNPYGDDITKTLSNDIEFTVSGGDMGDMGGNLDAIMHIAKVAKQMFSAMDNRGISISNVEFDDEDGRFRSVTVLASLLNINEPRKDMVPKYANRNGFANSNFGRPEVWSYTEN